MHMAKEEMTLDTLAQMVQRGFEKTATKAELEHVAKKADLGEFRTQVNTQLDHHDASLEFMSERLDGIDDRLDRIEQLLGEDYRRRLERLETTVQKLKAKVGVE